MFIFGDGDGDGDCAGDNGGDDSVGRSKENDRA